MNAVKEQYATLQKKYSLLSFEELDKEFELLSIPQLQEISQPLRFVRRRINDKIAWACNMLQSLLQPNPSSFINMYESSLFDKEEKFRISEFLKELMIIERESLCIDVNGNEKQDAEFISKTSKQWQIHKKEIAQIAEKLKKGWKQEKKKISSSYLG